MSNTIKHSVTGTGKIYAEKVKSRPVQKQPEEKQRQTTGDSVVISNKTGQAENKSHLQHPGNHNESLLFRTNYSAHKGLEIEHATHAAGHGGAELIHGNEAITHGAESLLVTSKKLLPTADSKDLISAHSKDNVHHDSETIDAAHAKEAAHHGAETAGSHDLSDVADGHDVTGSMMSNFAPILSGAVGGYFTYKGVKDLKHAVKEKDLFHGLEGGSELALGAQGSIKFAGLSFQPYRSRQGCS